MIELWILVWVSLTDPVSGAWVDNFGTFTSHDECIYHMREAEIMINRTNEGMLCLEVLNEPSYEMEDSILTEELQ